MSKHTVKGFITYRAPRWSDDTPEVSFQTWKPGSEYEADKVVVSTHTIEVEVPDGFNPVPELVAALEERKRQLRVKLSAELMEIDTQISKLTCIEFTAVTA